MAVSYERGTPVPHTHPEHTPDAVYRGRDCAKSLRSSYTGLYPQICQDLAPHPQHVATRAIHAPFVAWMEVYPLKGYTSRPLEDDRLLHICRAHTRNGLTGPRLAHVARPDSSHPHALRRTRPHRVTKTCYDERFEQVWRGSYSFALRGSWWSRTPRGLRNVLV